MTYEGATEIEADDGGKEVGIERGDNDTGQLDPVNFADSGGEEEEAFGEFWVADVDGDFWSQDGDEFGEGDDKEDAREGDEATGPLECFIFILTGAIDDSGLGFEGMEADEVMLAFRVKGSAPEPDEATEEGGAEESD